MMLDRRIFLLRHGQYDQTVQHTDGGPLTELGRIQAQQSARYLQSYPIGQIISSTMRRAQETAALIAQEMPQAVLSQSDLLREVVPTVPRDQLEYFTHLDTSPHSSFRMEQVADDRSQADAAFARFIQLHNSSLDQNPDVLLVCHGNLMRYLICRALEMEADHWARLRINHCGLSILEISNEGNFVLLSHNERSHLPRNLWSE